MFIEMHDIELKLNSITGMNCIIKMKVMKVSFKLSNRQALIHRLFNVFYMLQCPVNLISAFQMKRIDNIILDMMTDEFFDKMIKKIKILVKKVNDLFEMKTEYEIFVTLSIFQVNSEIWH